MTRLITQTQQLHDLCTRLRSAPRLGFDTEFVSEDTYRPHLCLVQVATDDEIALIDAIELVDMTPLWSVLAEGEHRCIVHAGREETNFCVTATGKPPANLLDVQLAAAFVGLDYPASYSNLVFRYLDRQVKKGETRTDWRRRPLTDAQLEYAAEDVRHLLPLCDELSRRLDDMQRGAWLQEETQAWLEDVLAAPNRPRWRRVSGAGSLSGKSLTILRELWLWRNELAQHRNRPPRRMLRDDLLVEIAKRRSADAKRIRSIRGFNRGPWERSVDEIAACVAKANSMPPEKSGRDDRRDLPNQLALLQQFLTPALTSICRRAGIAASLVGTASDVRDLIAHRLGFDDPSSDESPALTSGWRAELVGNVLNDLLEGKSSIRIEDANCEFPLTFDSV